MKKIRITSILVIIAVCFVFSACNIRFSEKYQFIDSEENIDAISIVKISYNDSSELIQTNIKTVDDKDGFLEKFRSVGCYIYFGDPVGPDSIEAEDKVIKINYKNGNYELINYCGQSEYISEKNKLSFYAGFNVFDKEQFEALISEYVTEEQ